MTQQMVVLAIEIPHYNDVIMGAIASQITSLTIVFSTVYLDTDQRKHQSSASLAFVRGIHRRPVNSPHKWPVTRKMFPFDDVIMINKLWVDYNVIIVSVQIATKWRYLAWRIFVNGGSGNGLLLTAPSHYLINFDLPSAKFLGISFRIK